MIPEYVDYGYVAKHLWRINTQYRNNQRMQDDSRYRIASHALGVYSADGSLTESDKVQLKEFIADFYASSEGSRAIADANNHW